jgi:hypothetical protein
MEELALYAIKLTSGEEILGKFVKQDGNCWVMKDVRSIIMMPDGQLRLGPVLFSANKDHEIEIFSTAIAVFSESVRPEFVEAYTQAVSPLSIPKKQIILG